MTESQKRVREARGSERGRQGRIGEASSVAAVAGGSSRRLAAEVDTWWLQVELQAASGAVEAVGRWPHNRAGCSVVGSEAILNGARRVTAQLLVLPRGGQP